VFIDLLGVRQDIISGKLENKDQTLVLGFAAVIAGVSTAKSTADLYLDVT
jgi:hypothetical protein